MDNKIDDELRSIGLNKIMGIDEAGRGALCSIVSVAGVMLPTNHKIEGLNDSKKISRARRIELDKLIREQAIEFHIAWADQIVIDQINILEATKLCIIQVINKFNVKSDMIVIDGKFNFGDDIDSRLPYDTIPKADMLSENVAAASIIAKNFRDNFMLEQHKLYPDYGFNEHFGYGTKKHRAAIEKYGPCPIHRRTFNPLRTMINKGMFNE